MDEIKRLRLFVEAVRYCQRVNAMGMPPSCYTKALREPIHFLWERRIGATQGRICGPKASAARLRSVEAVQGRPAKEKPVYHHVVPFKRLQDKLLSLSNVSPQSVRRLLNKYCLTALITKKEHQRLHGRGSGASERENPLTSAAHLTAAGLKMVKNKAFSRAGSDGN